MGWTDERVETLKRLWLDGLSASQIAKQLGGVTRNAVIGKVHRLGLSGRAAPSQPSKPVFKAPRPARPATGTLPTARRAVAVAEIEIEDEIVAAAAVADDSPAPVRPSQAQAPEAQAPQAHVSESQTAPEAPAQALVVAPERAAATVLTLGAHMCKWPIGDPSRDDFGFCGRRAPPEGPYCVEHARLAYQPQQARKKASTTELARSLRRYV